MVTVEVVPNYRNSPKNEFLKDFNVAFSLKDNEKIFDSVTEDIEWDIVGHKVIRGFAAFKKAVESIDDELEKVIIEKVLTHGNEGALQGKIISKDGKKFEYCDFYTFKSVKGKKIKKIKSFNINTKR